MSRLRCGICGERASRVRTTKGEERIVCETCGGELVARGWHLRVEVRLDEAVAKGGRKRLLSRWLSAIVSPEPDFVRLTRAAAKRLAEATRLPARSPGWYVRAHTDDRGVRLVHADRVRLATTGPRGGLSYWFPFASEEAPTP